MPTKSLQLDGPNLEELLARAVEAGPGGRVASADRVRRGGIAGFFAREHFEVTVEFDESAEAAEAADIDTDTAGAGGSAGPEGTPADAPRSWSDLADVTEDVLELSGTPRRAAMSGEEPAPEGAPGDGPEPLPLPLPAARVGSSVAPLGSASHLPSTQKASFAATLASIARDTVADDAPQPPSIAPAAEPPAGPGSGDWIEAIADATPEPAPPVLAADLIPETGTAPFDRRASVVADLVGPGLTGLGLPAELLPDRAVLTCLETLSAGDDARAYVQLALTTALQRLPEAPGLPERSGSILVAVGELDRALEFAAQAASRAGVDPGAIVVASEARHRRGVANRRLISSSDDALELSARSRRAPHMTIVALHAPVTAEPDPWAARMLQALEPTAVWGVTGATHKSEDMAAWADGLGGMDALAMEDIGSTLSPAHALAVGIPVASLDGQRATPALWAVLITARLLVEQAGRPAARRPLF